MSVVTRFAPSPTGFLHIGGARTALFNYLFARHMGGKFLLRIEDTDRTRSTEAAVAAIFEGLKWMGLSWDEEPVFQFARAQRHAEVAHQLLKEGKAYHCYCQPEELDRMREEAKAQGLPTRYNGLWRDRDPKDAPPGIKPVVRLKAPQSGETILHDLVQGEVKVANSQLDDMVLLRGDGTPTYMLSVVVDDHDMGITNVIRGDDHLTNTFRQLQIYHSMGWNIPQFAHIPLIHGPDGAKLSKRHGALGAESYRDMGFLPEAMRNYLLRLGWGHGDAEIISDAQAIEWFTIQAVGKSASRFDMVKLTSLNAHYIKAATPARLAELVRPFLEKELNAPLPANAQATLEAAIPGLQDRAKTLVDLALGLKFYFLPRPLPLDAKASNILEGNGAKARLSGLLSQFCQQTAWKKEILEQTTRTYAETTELKLGDLAQPLRAAITGSSVSPPIFEAIEILGREECLSRLADVGVTLNL